MATSTSVNNEQASAMLRGGLDALTVTIPKSDCVWCCEQRVAAGYTAATISKSASVYRLVY